MMVRIFTAPVDAVMSAYEAVRDGDKLGMAMTAASVTPVGRFARFGSAGRETTTLYRAVSEAEAASILATGKFSVGPNSLAGKWFAETFEHAKQWGDVMNGPGASKLLEVMLPRPVAEQLMRVNRLDGIGPARYAELQQLEQAAIRELP